MTIHNFKDYQARERQLDEDQGSAEVVDIALERMKTTPEQSGLCTNIVLPGLQDPGL